MTPTEALARIAALCDASDSEGDIAVRDVRAVLAEVTPEPGCTLDRDALMEAFRFMPEEYRSPATDWVLALVRPVAGVTLTPEEQAGIEWLLLQMTEKQKREAPSAPWRGLRALAARLEATR